MLNSLRQLYFWGNHLQNGLLLLIRLFWGGSFILAGWGKLANIDHVAAFFTMLGIPHPFFNAYFTGSVELICGFLIFIGLISRLAAIPLIITMIVAFLTAHYDAVQSLFTDPDLLISQTAFTYLFASVLIFCFGPGKISFDYLFKIEK